jgi:hypothetical protein
MSKLDLQAIRKRAEAAMNGNPFRDLDAIRKNDYIVLKDVPALIAEVERLNGVVGTLVSDLELIEDHTEGRGLLIVQEAIKYGEEELR